MRADRLILFMVLLASSAGAARWRRAIYFDVSAPAPARASLRIEAADGTDLWSKTISLGTERTESRRSVLARGWTRAAFPARAHLELNFEDGGTFRCEVALEPIEVGDEVLQVAGSDGGCRLELAGTVPAQPVGVERVFLRLGTNPGGDFGPYRPPWTNAPPRPGHDEFLH